MVLVTQFTSNKFKFSSINGGRSLNLSYSCSALGEGNGARQEETRTRNSLSLHFFYPARVGLIPVFLVIFSKGSHRQECRVRTWCEKKEHTRVLRCALQNGERARRQIIARETRTQIFPTRAQLMRRAAPAVVVCAPRLPTSALCVIDHVSALGRT